MIHRALVDVDEKGTEAAAATATMLPTAIPLQQAQPLVIRIDRPFLFMIVDTKSSAVLFIGRMVDPSA